MDKKRKIINKKNNHRKLKTNTVTKQLQEYRQKYWVYVNKCVVVDKLQTNKKEKKIIEKRKIN